MTSAGPVRVGVPGGVDYDVVVGEGVRGAVADALPARTRSVLLLTQPGVEAWAEDVTEALRSSGRRVHVGVVPAGEEAKTLAEAARWWDACGDAGLTRADAVVGVGGGAVTDLAGLVAAGWMRGIAVAHVPTTLLGMVDAAVGGKTGVNTPHGKNLVGAFHHPSGVVCDLETLSTLPDADLVAGMAEVVKCGAIADPAILGLIAAAPTTVARPHGGRGPASTIDVRRLALGELVRRSVEVKARVVGSDPRESGQREVLNYGHTFGHAIEHAQGYRWRHGEAVAVGMVYVAELAARLGVGDPGLADAHRQVLTRVGLPVRYAGSPGDCPGLVAAMARDKKALARAIRFVTLGHRGGEWATTAVDPERDADVLAAAREAVR